MKGVLDLMCSFCSLAARYMFALVTLNALDPNSADTSEAARLNESFDEASLYVDPRYIRVT